MIRNILIRNKTTKQTQLNRILWEADSLLVNSRNSQPFYGKLMFIFVFTTGPADLTIGCKWQTICIVFGRFPVWISDEHNVSWKEMQVFLDVTPCWVVSGYKSVGRDVLEDVRASTTQLQGPEILAQYPEWVSRVVLTFFRHMAPVLRSIPSTGFSGHYSQIIVALKAVEAGLTVFSHVLKPKIKKRNIRHTHNVISCLRHNHSHYHHQHLREPNPSSTVLLQKLVDDFSAFYGVQVKPPFTPQNPSLVPILSQLTKQNYTRLPDPNN